jgi:hypothetical protein
MTQLDQSGRAILHIGTHKTGTTSIQSFIQRNVASLHAAGIVPYLGQHIGHNHVELHVAAMRPDRRSGFKARSGISPDPSYVASVRDQIAAAAEEQAGRTILFSAEGLSLLRHPDELERLATLLPFSRVDVVIAVRNPSDFLTSYRFQIGNKASFDRADYEHYNYVGDDTWLTDVEARLALWRKTFGAAAVTVIHYDNVMRAEGTILPAFLRAIGAEALFDPADLRTPFLNRSPPRDLPTT